MSLFPGDLAIINAVYKYRFVSTSQLAEVVGRHEQVIRRANRKRLRPEGYIVNFQRLPTEEAAYTLGAKGLELMAREMGCSVNQLPFPKSVSTARSFFFKHLLMITQTRIAFDLAAASDASPIRIGSTIAEWETKPSTRPSAPHHERFVLSERLTGANGATYFHRPDCLFLMHAKEAPNQLVAVFCECDRGTESMSRIENKLHAYYAYYCQRRFADAFGAVAMRILFVLTAKDETRIASMHEMLRRFASEQSDSKTSEGFRRSFRFVLASAIDRTTALSSPIYYDADGNRRVFFQRVPPTPHGDAGPEVAA